MRIMLQNSNSMDRIPAHPTKEYVRNFKFFYAKRTQFQKSQMTLNSYMTKEYDENSDWTIGENEPKTKPNEPN